MSTRTSPRTALLAFAICGTTYFAHLRAIAPPTNPIERPDTILMELSIREFPNPFRDHVVFTMPQGLMGHTRAEIDDEAGRSVIQWPLGFAEATGSLVTLDTSTLEPGSYMFRVLDEYGHFAEQRLICN
jgi:hypothetical protein